MSQFLLVAKNSDRFSKDRFFGFAESMALISVCEKCPSYPWPFSLIEIGMKSLTELVGRLSGKIILNGEITDSSAGSIIWENDP